MTLLHYFITHIASYLFRWVNSGLTGAMLTFYVKTRTEAVGYSDRLWFYIDEER